MSDSDVPDLPDDPDAVLAAEYVLRLLDAEGARACAERVASEPGFAAEVARWELAFAGLDGEFATVEPPRAMRARVEAAIFGASPPLASRLWTSIALWRGVAAAAIAATVAVVVFGPPALRPEAPDLVATVAPAVGDVQLVVRLDRTAGALRFTRVAGSAPPGRSLELWLLPQGETTPTSLGVMPDEARFAVPLTAALADRVIPGTAILVSQEAEGGSPTGLPQGPVLASGAISEL